LNIVRSLLGIACICVLSFGGVRADSAVPKVLQSSIPPPKLDSVSWILQDHKSGWVIASHQSDLRVEPASLSKLMTAYIVFDEIHKGNLSKTDTVRISKKAWQTGGSRMFVEVNSRVAVDELLKGLIVQSGNDAAVALAEHIAGSEEGFAELMNQTAARLGLVGTHYMNSTGLPHEDHYTTARDLSRLTRALIRDFSEDYSLYSVKSYTYNGITQQNRNLLLWRDEAVDGVKTGHTSSAGYCLVGSAEKQGMRLIATVMGTSSKAYRADAVHALLNFGFAAYEGFLIYPEDQVVASPQVYKGDADTVDAVVKHALHVTVAKGSASSMKAGVEFRSPLVAPIGAGTDIGTLSLRFKGELIGEYPLVARQRVAQGSWLSRSVDSIKLLVH